jgi:hypothetical protein
MVNAFVGESVSFGLGLVSILFNEISIMMNLREDSSSADSAWSIIEDEDSDWGAFAQRDWLQHPKLHDCRAAQVRYRIIKTLEHEGLPSDALLMQKVFTINDVEGLWFFRTDIMHDLSMRFGEQEAQIIMGDITPLFAGLVPDSMFRRTHIPFEQARPAPTGYSAVIPADLMVLAQKSVSFFTSVSSAEGGR